MLSVQSFHRRFRIINLRDELVGHTMWVLPFQPIFFHMQKREI